MSDAPRPTRIFTRWPVVSWLALLFLLPPLETWFAMPRLLFAFMDSVRITLQVLIVSVPLWAIWRALVSGYRRRWGDVARYFAILPLGVAGVILGVVAGDMAVIMIMGPQLKRAVAEVKAHGTWTGSKTVEASSIMAVLKYPDYLFRYSGLLYDETRSAAQMLPIIIPKRAKEWQDNAVPTLQCLGWAEHLAWNYYRFSVSDCAE